MYTPAATHGEEFNQCRLLLSSAGAGSGLGWAGLDWAGLAEADLLSSFWCCDVLPGTTSWRPAAEASTPSLAPALVKLDT